MTMSLKCPRGALLLMLSGEVLALRSSFVNNGQWKSFGISQNRGDAMTMYFDDVSRHAKQWEPDMEQFPWLHPKNETQNDLEASFVKEKLEALKVLTGYNVEDAAGRSEDEIEEEIRDWATRSGLVGTELGDEVYGSIDEIHVSDATTVPECMAEFWALSDEAATNTGGSNLGDYTTLRASRLTMVVFPHCEELYEYETLATLHTAIDFCSHLCLHFGKDFQVTHFHPRYKDSPRILYPTRHAPFPALGLHHPGSYDSLVNHLSEKYGETPVKLKLAQNEPPALRDWAKERAATFEILLNKAAASSTRDDLQRPASLRNMSQRFDDEEVIQSIQRWIQQNREVKKAASNESTKTERNRALEFADTIQDWKVVSEKRPEAVYAAMWKMVGELRSHGEVCDESLKTSPKRPLPEKSSDWITSLHLPFKGVKSSASTVPNVVSFMFISTKFKAYNAEGFKRFAITVNAALKRVTGGKIFLEVFHPEYVGKNGYDNSMRRSPFPCIQICYEVGKSKK